MHAPPVRLLLYGDSLTAGYCNCDSPFPEFEPYGRALVDALGAEIVEAEIVGLCGLPAQHMVSTINDNEVVDNAGRKGAGLLALLDRPGPPFDHALIMAGTNDLPT